MRLGERLGFEGEGLRNFVLEQQQHEREERQRLREEKRQIEELEEKRRVEELEEKRRVEELEERRRVEELEERRRIDELQERREIREFEERSMMRAAELSNNNSNTDAGHSKIGPKAPKLPMFVEERDNMDAYLLRFERTASSNCWDKEIWAGALSALLTGKALETYSSLSAEDAGCYEKLKRALLQRFVLTEDGYREKFRTAKPGKDETPTQFMARIQNYFRRWFELSGEDQTVSGITDLVLREQFLQVCKPELSVHLKMNQGSLERMVGDAEIFLNARSRKFSHFVRTDVTGAISARDMSRKNDGVTEVVDTMEGNTLRCFKCSETGHKAIDCPKKRKDGTEIKCFTCQGPHHQRFCKSRSKNDTRAGVAKLNSLDDQDSCGCARLHELEGQAAPREELDVLSLQDGSKLKVVRSGGSFSDEGERKKDQMPVYDGMVGENHVQVLRDTGCNGVIVKSKFVEDGQFTGKLGYMLRVDNTVIEARKARINIDTPFLKGTVEALCLQDALYDLIIGNVQGVEPICSTPSKVDRSEGEESNTMLQSQDDKAASALKTPLPSDELLVDRERLIQLQSVDRTLTRLDTRGTQSRGKAEIGYRRKGDILYRIYQHPKLDFGKVRWQVLVPQILREHVMKVAHESIVAGHMGVQRTIERITSSFYWPGIYGDVKRYCMTCDICQKTVKRGSIPKAPLEKMPLIDTPFKRVAVDLVGPISPPSEEGHRYILTLVDYATRYPEAVALKNIEAETVAEALVGIYCRVGVPEEMLTDMGTQFISKCMKEVSRLLSVKQLTTTPYNPQCNGLVERFNGTLKTMMKKLCSEQPRQWNRYIEPLLFAYREVPQETTGFSPFELLYGRQVRGPMQILKDLWTNEYKEADVRVTYQYVLELQERLERTLTIAKEELEKSQSKFVYKNRRAKKRILQDGDEVLLLLPSSHNKLLMKWKGPFFITKQVSNCNYKVMVDGKEKLYHINLMKKYMRRPSNENDTLVDKQVVCGSVAVINDADKGREKESEDDEELIPLYPVQQTQSIDDVQINDKLSAEMKSSVEVILKEFSAVFTDQPGKCTEAQHDIKLTDDRPVVSRPYSMPFALRESVQNDLDKMLRLGVIRHSSSPYASPVVVVRKKDGSNRVCIDYRKLNRITEFDPQPLMPVKEVVRGLGNCQFFTKLDMTSGYWQIPINPDDIPKTAFVTHDAKYEFTRAPFGMVNSGATLCRCLKQILSGIPGVTNYVDDILIYTFQWDEHLKILREVLKRLKSAGLTVKPSKCNVACNETVFLGHRISQGEVEPQLENAKKISEATPPKTKKDVRSFLGLTGFYQDFIPEYAAKAAPLTDLLRKGKPEIITWGEAQERAFFTLKNSLITEPILRLPDLTKSFILKTDASDFGVGAALCQKFEDGVFPVAYASRKLLDRERKYSVMERECLAIIFGVKKFAVYLIAKKFILQTDHQPLAYLQKAKFESGRVMRWALFLQSYQFRIEPIKGRENVAADYLSRSAT